MNQGVDRLHFTPVNQSHPTSRLAATALLLDGAVWLRKRIAGHGLA
jgi:hypothetical protein